MKRYEGSEIIGYRPAKFEEFVLPEGPPKQFAPAIFEKSLEAEGLVTRCTYLAPTGRSPAEMFRNYSLKFNDWVSLPSTRKWQEKRAGLAPRSIRLLTRIK